MLCWFVDVWAIVEATEGDAGLTGKGLCELSGGTIANDSEYSSCQEFVWVCMCVLGLRVHVSICMFVSVCVCVFLR